MSRLKRLIGAIWAFGERCRHERYVDILRARYDIDPSFDVRRNAQVYGDGSVRLGPNSYINNNTRLVATAGCTLRVGRNCRIAENCRIETQSGDPDHDYKSGPPANPKSGDITIGDYVWIGAGTYVGPGISIGDGAVIGANSVVGRSVEPNEIVAGAPLRHLRFKADAS